MKPLYGMLLFLAVQNVRVVSACQVTNAATSSHVSAGATASSEPTSAQQLMAAARQQMALDPKKLQTYNDLAAAQLRRGRETDDASFMKEAEKTIADGLQLDPNDFSLLRTRVALLLQLEKFSEAKQLANQLHRRLPDDVMTYGYLAEVDLALGNYAEAEENAQWMMNLRPNNTPALLVGAKLRSAWGDSRGAVEFLNQAFAQTSPLEVEELAWIANQIAHVQVERGEFDAAAKTLHRAEELFTPYPFTMENLARVRMSQNRPEEAALLLVKATSVDRDPHQLDQLAKAQQAAGEHAEAQATFAKFEKLAQDPASATRESSIDLVLWKAENPGTAQDALKLAQQQVAQQQDVWTLDAYAWALFANGKYVEAEQSIQRALAVGIQSAQIFDHAGHIEQKLNKDADANKNFELALATNPSSEFSADARSALKQSSVATAIQQASAPSAQADALLLASRSVDSSRNPSESAPGAPAHAVNPIQADPHFLPIPAALLTSRPTETEQQIRHAQSEVARAPKDARLYAALGAAYFQHARETGDVSDYELAEKALQKSIDLDPSDFSSESAYESMAEVCMGEHRFSDALAYAHRALSLGSGELSPFAILGDAYADMGQYSKAEHAYQRLTPRDTILSPRAAYASDSRLSYLKFIAGNTQEAIKLMQTAVLEGVEAQLPSENLAWLYYELGEYLTQDGDAAAANSAYLAALNAHPGDYRALAALAKLRANHGRYEEAIELYKKAIAVVPMPTYIAELGDVYARSGNRTEAEKQYALVEYIGLLGHINQVLHNRDLAIFYADHDRKLDEALNLARKELEVRRDVYTLDALAWALYKNGKVQEAAKTSQDALRFGTQDSLILFHAGTIDAAAGHPEQARKDLQQALQINPHFHLSYASDAQARLAALQTQVASKEGPAPHAR